MPYLFEEPAPIQGYQKLALESDCSGKCAGHSAVGLRMGRVALSRVLNGHAGVSAALALALERIGWSDAEHWMRMQAIYDLAQERRKQAGAAA